ncbi:hypothetical protein F2P81_014008 [Scophthalmus maximus]|uniref:RecQ-mediated genome instability protein 1 C-terminal OB-fold domain-containing protein n=1 Tax=Scophthalmus maximus TaxID=52904 RepID=A0A6A4SV32_SCOMX|nr:hypothetical protein F2P81_014008 [Scophthalmus maximus]
MLCRTLGLPEEQQQQQQEQDEAPPAPQRGKVNGAKVSLNEDYVQQRSARVWKMYNVTRGSHGSSESLIVFNHEVEDLELDDAELLASLEAQEEVIQVGSVRDSGYGTRSETSTQSSRSSSVRSFVSAASSRSEASIHSYRSGLTQSSRGGSIQRHRLEREDSDPFDILPSDHEFQPEVQPHGVAEEDFPDEDFDDLPLDELDSEIFQETTNVTAQSDIRHRSTSPDNSRTTGNPNSLDSTTKLQTAQFERHISNGSGSRLGSGNSRSIMQKRDYEGFSKGEFVRNDDNDFMDEDMDCFLEEVETHGVQTQRTGGQNHLPVQQGPGRDGDNATKAGSSGYSHTLTSNSSRSVRDRFPVNTELAFKSSRSTPPRQISITPDRLSAKKEPQSDSTGPALTLTSPPFTYLCLLEDLKTTPQPYTTEIRVKAFIVTLLGKLSSSNKVWSISATISDGTGYLDAELSDEVLTGLLGFSVVEKASLKRDPARRGELDVGMRRCQEELVDMCCVMTIVVGPQGRKPVVTMAEQVSEKVLQELEQRARDLKK